MSGRGWVYWVEDTHCELDTAKIERVGVFGGRGVFGGGWGIGW